MNILGDFQDRLTTELGTLNAPYHVDNDFQITGENPGSYVAPAPMQMQFRQ